MICVYITDSGTWSDAVTEEHLRRLPPTLSVPPTKERLLLRHRIAVRTVLWRYVGDVTLGYAAGGAPYLAGSPLHISISHDGALCALAVSDEGAIGVDIQGMCQDTARMARLRERFFNRLPAEDPPALSGVCLYYCKDLPQNENNSLQNIPFSPCDGRILTATEKDVLRWTQLEAVLKADGRGFAAYPQIRALWHGVRVGATVTEDASGQRYILSLAAAR